MLTILVRGWVAECHQPAGKEIAVSAQQPTSSWLVTWGYHSSVGMVRCKTCRLWQQACVQMHKSAEAVAGYTSAVRVQVERSAGTAKRHAPQTELVKALKIH